MLKTYTPQRAKEDSPVIATFFDGKATCRGEALHYAAKAGRDARSFTVNKLPIRPARSKEVGVVVWVTDPRNSNRMTKRFAEADTVWNWETLPDML